MAFCLMTSAAYAADEVTANCGETVYIMATPKTGSHFVRWDDNGNGYKNATRAVEVSADMTYKAIFALDSFLIVFKNEDGTVLQSDSLAYGETPAYTGATPTKSATAQYTYTFKSWDKAIVDVTEAATYTATYNAAVNQYTITFKNWNGQALQTSKFEYGKIPTYKGETPTKTGDAYTYTFKGWSPDTLTTPVSKDTVFVAQFDSVIKTFTVTVTKEGEGTVSDKTGTYQYGQQIELTATAAQCYDFTGWKDGATDATRTVTVTANVTYTAVFTIQQYTIKVATDQPSLGTVGVSKTNPNPTPVPRKEAVAPKKEE